MKLKQSSVTVGCPSFQAKRPWNTACLLISLLLLLSSCVKSRHPAAIASSTSPLPRSYASLGQIQKESCSSLLFFIPLSLKDDPNEIIRAAINEIGADAIVGVTVEYEKTFFSVPIVGSECTILKGEAVKSMR